MHADDDGTVLDTVDSSISRGVDVNNTLVIMMERSGSRWPDELEVGSGAETFRFLQLTSEVSKTDRLPPTEADSGSDFTSGTLPSLPGTSLTVETCDSVTQADTESTTKHAP